MTVDNKRLSSPSFIFCGLILFLIIGLYSILSFLTPTALDDWMFMGEWRNINGDATPGWASLFEFWKEIRLYDNGRLSNTFSPIFTMFSPGKELFPLLTGLCIGFIILFIIRLSFPVKEFSPFVLSFVWLLVLYMLPWRNSLFVTDYSLNYIWGTVVTMCFMMAVIHCETKGWNWYKLLGVLFLAFLAGGWHEGFAIATTAGFLLYTLLCKRKFSLQWYVTGIFYVAVTLGFYLCPGLLARTVHQIGTSRPDQTILKLTVDFSPVLLICFLILTTAVVPSLRIYLRKARQSPWFIISLGGMAVGVLLSLLFEHQPRSAFWPDILAIIMIVTISRPVLSKISKSNVGRYLTVLMLIFCLVPFYFILKAQYGYYKEALMLVREIEKSESGTVYHDIIEKETLPLMALRIPTFNLWVTPFHYQSLNECFHKDIPAVVPTGLSNPDISHARKLPGSIGAYNLGNNFFVPYALVDEYEVKTVVIINNSGESSKKEALLLPYLTENGEIYTYIQVFRESAQNISSLSLPTP